MNKKKKKKKWIIIPFKQILIKHIFSFSFNKERKRGRVKSKMIEI